MRFSDVLIFNSLTHATSFNFKNFCAMRDIQAGDVEHIGHVVKCLLFGLAKTMTLRIPYTNWNLLLNADQNKLDMVEMPVSDFTMGLIIAVPTSFTMIYAFNKLPMKPYIIMGLCLWSIMPNQ